MREVPLYSPRGRLANTVLTPLPVHIRTCGMRVCLQVLLRVWGFGFGVWGLVLHGVSDLGFRVSGFGFRGSGFGFRVSGLVRTV